MFAITLSFSPLRSYCFFIRKHYAIHSLQFWIFLLIDDKIEAFQFNLSACVFILHSAAAFRIVFHIFAWDSYTIYSFQCFQAFPFSFILSFASTPSSWAAISYGLIRCRAVLFLVPFAWHTQLAIFSFFLRSHFLARFFPIFHWVASFWSFPSIFVFCGSRCFGRLGFCPAISLNFFSVFLATNWVWVGCWVQPCMLALVFACRLATIGFFGWIRAAACQRLLSIVSQGSLIKLSKYN